MRFAHIAEIRAFCHGNAEIWHHFHTTDEFTDLLRFWSTQRDRPALADKWGVNVSLVRKYYAEGRIPNGALHGRSREQIKQYLNQGNRVLGTAKVGRDWVLLNNAKFPIDMRRKLPE